MASVSKRKDGRPGYQVRYRDPAAVQRARQLVRKAAADQFGASVETDKTRGSYIDASLQQVLAPRYVRVIFANLSAVLAAAVDDERIVRNPCRVASVKPSPAPSGKVVPWTPEQVAAVRHGLPPRYRAMATLGAGCGLRQGEVFGLAVDDVDFLRGVVHVRRQVKLLGGRQVLAPRKGRKVREVPLPESVALDLAAHLQAWPAVPIDLSWEDVSGAPRSAELLLSTRETTALQRNYVNTKIWKPALVAAGLPPTLDNGMHALRHFYASVLLDAGELIRALAEYLGHADPGFTLRVYTHLMPASEERTRRAADRALPGGALVDGSTGCAPDVHHEAL